MPVNLLEFPDRETASEAAAEWLAKSIRHSLEHQDRSGIVVSGGTTPGPCFDRLSAIPLEWSRVTVIPSDERWVPGDHPDSNERLIRSRLLVNRAQPGHLLPLYREGVEPGAALSMIKQDLLALGAPACCALLGMGEDGHFASLFPDFDRLQQALDPGYSEPCLVVRTASSPHVRISLSLAALLETERTLLLIFGAAKRKVIDAAAAGNTTFPIESLITNLAAPLSVFWAP